MRCGLRLPIEIEAGKTGYMHESITCSSEVADAVHILRFLVWREPYSDGVVNRVLLICSEASVAFRVH
jgi:hypothetical protein